MLAASASCRVDKRLVIPASTLAVFFRPASLKPKTTTLMENKRIKTRKLARKNFRAGERVFQFFGRIFEKSRTWLTCCLNHSREECLRFESGNPALGKKLSCLVWGTKSSSGRGA